jgi:folate-dependent phosphoribosylglycinamide formyltransferase PurN
VRGETTLRGLVLLINNNVRSRIIYHALANEFSIDAVVREEKVARSTFLKRRFKKLGWRTLLGQGVFETCIVPWLRRETAAREGDILWEYGMDEGPIPAECVIDVSSVNDDRTLTLLKDLSPRVVVVNGTRILEERLLNAIDAVFLNTHVGITPFYRGVHGGYWALVARDPEHCGVTIHKIDKGIDTGAIVAHALIKPTAADNFSTYPLLQIANAIPLLRRAIRDALDGKLETLPAPAGRSKLWSHPTAYQYLKHRVTLGVR